MKKAKITAVLSMTMLLNGSFTPVGESKSSQHVYNTIGSDSYEKSVKDSVAYQVSVFKDKCKHYDSLRLDLVASRNTGDSLRALVTNTTPSGQN